MRRTGELPDWRLFGEMSPEEIANDGKFSTSGLWIQAGYGWFYKRLPSSMVGKYPCPRDVPVEGPPSRYVPFPISVSSSERNFNAGKIAFLSVDSNGSRDAGNREPENNAIKRVAHEAASYVYDLFRAFQPQIGFPYIEILSQPADGKSLSLSAIIAALCRILNIPCPDTLIATGSFRDNQLKTVGEDTLWQKIVAASRYGYQKLILVEGQKGEWNNVSMSPEELRKTLQEEKILPQDTALRFMEVPQEPLKAFFRILREMPHGAAEEMAILLAAFDKKYLRSDPAHGEEDFLNTVLPFVQSPCNLVRHVALDILCRRELHLGNTPQAEVYRREIPTLRPSEFPPGRLGYYLKYEEAASKAVLDLDLGNWDADHSDHQLLERILVRLKSSVRDGLADIEEIRNAMAIANTKGRRLMFQGRLSGNPIFLKEAWNEFICFEEYWEEIFKYAAKLGLPNENMRRQRNQCVECIADYWYLTREVLQCPRLCLEIPFEKENNYDIAAELSWRVTQNPPEAIPVAPLLKNADRNYESWKGYPNFLPYEKVLIYGLGDASDREHARQQLSEASHLKEPFERSGILALLGMRSAYVLENMGLVYQIYHELADGNPLRKVAEKMMEEPEKMGFRCPY